MAGGTFNPVAYKKVNEMSKEIAKKDKTSVGNAVPGFMAGYAGQGTEALSQDAIQPPRIKLMQAISPELDEYDGLQAGDWLNTVTGTNYGKTVQIIPIYLTEAYFLFSPRVPGVTGGLLARANDGVHWSPANRDFEVTLDKKGRKTTWTTRETVSKSGLAAWGTSDPDDENSPPAAQHAINCLLLLADNLNEGPMVLSYMRSALKIGKKFAGNLKLSSTPSFGRVFELSSMKIPGPSGDYLEPRVKAAGFLQDEIMFNAAKELYESARERGVSVDIAEEDDAAASTADDSNAAF